MAAAAAAYVTYRPNVYCDTNARFSFRVYSPDYYLFATTRIASAISDNSLAHSINSPRFKCRCSIFNETEPTILAKRLCHSLTVSGLGARDSFGIWTPLMNRPKAILLLSYTTRSGQLYFMFILSAVRISYAANNSPCLNTTRCSWPNKTKSAESPRLVFLS